MREEGNPGNVPWEILPERLWDRVRLGAGRGRAAARVGHGLGSGCPVSGPTAESSRHLLWEGVW